MKNFIYGLILLGCLVIMSCGDDETSAPAPIANFTSTVEGKTVTFTNTSTDATSYSWDFGDGNSSADASPTHTYGSNGSYVAKLTASGDGGSDDKQAVLEVINVAIDGDLSDWANTAVSIAPTMGTITSVKFENLENNKLFIYIEGTEELTALTQILLNIDNDKTTGAFIDWFYLQGGEDLLIEGSLPASDEQYAGIYPCFPCDGSNPGNWNWGDPTNEDASSFIEASPMVATATGNAYEVAIDLTALGQAPANDAIGIAVIDVSLDTWGPVGSAPDFYEENTNPEGTLFNYVFE